MEKQTWETVSDGPVSGSTIGGRATEHTSKLGFRNGALYRTIVITDKGVSVATAWVPASPGSTK